MTFTFRDIPLRVAEEEIVGAAIDFEHALVSLYGTTRVQSFRSEQAYELNQIANVLFAWHDKGLYTPDTARPALEKHFDPGYIHELWCPMGHSIEYVDALCMALARGEELHQEAVTARFREINEAPFRPASPPPARPRPRPKGPPPPPKKGGHVGGVLI